MKQHFRAVIGAILIGSLSLIVTSCQSTSKVFGVNESKSSTDFVMGTAFTTTLYGKNIQSVQDEISSELSMIDGQISWRNESSDISEFNRTHQVRITSFEPAITTALDVAAHSQGAFDPTVLPVSGLWDIGGDNERHPQEDEILKALEHVGYEKLSMTDDVLTSDDPAVALELGAIGKGYALMKAGECLKADNITGGIISAGSSITTYGEKPDGSSFKVGLRDPRGTVDELIGAFTLTDTSMSTSGDYEKYFEEDGVRYHHIIDPRTGYPAQSGLMSVTIIDGDSTLCDALSTACFVLGLDEGMALAEDYGVDAVFIDTQKQVYITSGIQDILDFYGEESGYTMQLYEAARP